MLLLVFKVCQCCCQGVVQYVVVKVLSRCFQVDVDTKNLETKFFIGFYSIAINIPIKNIFRII